MKRLFSFLCVLCCASMMGFAIDWSGYAWIGNGSGNAAYTDKFKMTLAEGQGVVNIQQPPFATAPGIYTTFPAGISACSLPVGSYDIQGAGMILHVAAFTAQETEVTVTHGTGVAVFTVYYADGTTGGGGGDPDPDPDPDPAPAGIDWSSIGWLTNASGNPAFTNKYKALAGDPGPANIDVIQNPGWATAPGLYMTFPNADFRNFSLPASCYDTQGAGVIFHMNAFTAKETKVHVNVGGTVRSFTIYYEDGAEGPAEIYDINFALADNGSSATASSGTASAAIDGNEGTRWESSSTDDETWTLDMGQKRIFNTIKILWESAFCKEYTLSYSNDGEEWAPLYVETNLTQAGWQTIELGENVTAQYIKYHGTLRATGWGQSFFEFQVFLAGVSVLTSIDLTAPAQIAQVGGAGVALTAQPKDQNGQNMEAEVSYEITPAAAGHMSGNTYIPDQVGSASIRAYSGEVYSPAVSIIGVASANLALSTNISTDNKIVAQSAVDPNGSQYDAFYAVDGNLGSVWQGRPDGISGGDDAARTFDSWFVVDLGAFYNIDLVALHFEGACSELYHIDFSENNTDWNLGYNLVGAGGINARNDYWTELDNNIKVRYVRFWSTKAATEWGMKLFEFEVYGTEWTSGDEEAPVMVSASLVSSTVNSAVIAVSATDNEEVTRYHVVDATNGIDANFTPSEDNITITGLTHATDYNFTITAKDASGNESENSIVVAVSTPFDGSINLALNKTSEAGYDDGNPTELADAANDGKDNTAWVTYANQPASVEWWVVDLGEIYNLTNITALWGGDFSTNYILQARVEAPSAADKADDAAWVTLATVTGAAANAEKSTDVSGVGRYVRFRSVTRSGVCIRLRELRVYASGIATVDTEKPVITSASLVSNTDVQAVITVAATDNVGVANYHVVDAGNSFDGNFVAEEGRITVTGLTGGTSYTFVITAVDLFGNESANNKSVAVTTTAHYTAPQAACAAPTWPANQVKAMYSPNYEADCGFDAWGSGTIYTQETYGKKYVLNNNGYFGMVGFSLNCLMMEKLHYDIWIADDATIRFVPIWGGAEQGITKSLTGQQWNSIDIDLSEYTSVTDWGNVYQMKIDQAYDLTFWVANAYFYRETAIVDTEAPTEFTASVAEIGFYSVKVTAQASDNSGAVNFAVKNGEEVLATGAAVTATPTTITVNNLASGTAYNLSVVAYDDANNTTSPIALNATTKFVPAPIVPDFNAKDVLPVFTDAMACVVNNIHSGGWGEATQHEWLQIAPNDKVFYAQNFNFAGWHSWGGGDIDASEMDFLHVDIYSTGMTQVSVTPISHDPTREGNYAVSLTPNAWTSVDIPLSEYADNNIEWNKIFQFKFMGAVGGNELMIDNVYFFRYQAKSNVDGWATFASPVAVKVPSGVTVYKAVYEQDGDDEILRLTPAGDVIPANTGALLQCVSVSTNYAFDLATSDEAEAAESAFSGNNLVGCAVKTDISAVAATHDIFALRHSDLFGYSGFFLYSGTTVNAGKAYLPLLKDDATPAPSRRVRFVIDATDAATAIDANALEATHVTKFVQDGQLFILRDNVVYTVQGERVK